MLLLSTAICCCGGSLRAEAGAAEPESKADVAEPEPIEPKNARRGRGGFSVRQTEYHGWPDALILSNGKAEVVIVPAIGRIMQFRFLGDESGPFWENRALNGKLPDAKSTEWRNFGGDKVWPAPQADWREIAGRAWPPPPAFDSMPVGARVEGHAVILESPIDPFYGIRTVRQITLDPRRPIMLIKTRFEKMEGPPRKVSIWVVTQLKDPARVAAHLPKQSVFPEGFVQQSKALPMGLGVGPDYLALSRDRRQSHKIGLDAGTLIWVEPLEGDPSPRVDAPIMLRIDSPRVPGVEYPDQQSSAEIYTSGNPLRYVELEMLGPLQTLSVGEHIERTSLYWLARRTHPDPETDALRYLGIR